MKRVVLFIILWFVWSFALFQGFSQSVNQLKKQRQEIQNQINATNKKLRETIKTEKSSNQKLQIIKKNLNDRKQLISVYNAEINALSGEIKRLSQEKSALENELEKQKKEYANLIQNTQMNKNFQSELFFLFSAKTYDQSIRRARYLREFSDYKKMQIGQIKNLKTNLELKSDSLDLHKKSKSEILRAKEIETVSLQKEEKSVKILNTQFKKEEQKLTQEFRAHQQKRDQIDRKIEQVIAEEIRKAEEKKRAEEKRRLEEQKRREAAELAKKKTESTPKEATKVDAKKETTPKVTPERDDAISKATREENLLTGNFEKNRGRLPWPVDRGIISGHFGTYSPPGQHHVTVNNRGVYFRSPAGTNARSVYDGVVTRQFMLAGSGTIVIVQHGTYRTVYGNLSKVYVKEGQKVSTKQAIGQIFTDESNGQAELHFQIWQGSTLTNPEKWITK
jgi:septal ring factor EnvC (AmiA/AmiB activator)